MVNDRPDAMPRRSACPERLGPHLRIKCPWETTVSASVRQPRRPGSSVQHRTGPTIIQHSVIRRDLIMPPTAMSASASPPPTYATLTIGSCIGFHRLGAPRCMCHPNATPTSRSSSTRQLSRIRPVLQRLGRPFVMKSSAGDTAQPVVTWTATGSPLPPTPETRIRTLGQRPGRLRELLVRTQEAARLCLDDDTHQTA
jgi:hypothetical protein